MLDQMISSDTLNAISSPESEDGATLSDFQDGQILARVGLSVAPANLSARQAKAAGLLMSGTYGRLPIGSSPNVDPSQFLVNRLRVRLDSAGSTLFNLIWKERRTPQGQLIYALRASGLRTSGKDCTSVPTPNVHSGSKEGMSPTGVLDGKKYSVSLESIAKFSSVPTPRTVTGGAESAIRKQELGRTESGGGDLQRIALLAACPTPRSEDSQCAGSHRGVPDSMHSLSLLSTVATPRSNQTGHSTGNPDRAMNHKSRLEDQVFLAITSVAMESQRDYKDTAGMAVIGENPDGSQRTRLDQLPRQAQLADSGQTVTGGTGETKNIGQLNPDYSRWLMGFPVEWGSCADMAMLLSRGSRRSSSKQRKSVSK